MTFDVKKGDKVRFKGTNRLGLSYAYVVGAEFEVTDVSAVFIELRYPDDSGTRADWLVDPDAPFWQEFEPVAPADTPDSETPENYVADEAKRIVNGARQAAYGGPEDNFERIARFWTAYFQNTGRDIEVTAKDVSPMMRLLKEARICSSPDHMDSHVDLVGYALTGARVNEVKIPIDPA